ncbi:MAG: ion channel [Rhodovibrionaceae bacterium]
MILAIIAALALVVCSVLVQYRVLNLTAVLLERLRIPAKSRILMAVAGVLSGQLISILLFALIYAAFHFQSGAASLAGKLEGNALDFFYFSIMSFTTLGIGDIYATGPLRIVAGFQGLTGFVMIGWSASFAYMAMRNAGLGTRDEISQ